MPAFTIEDENTRTTDPYLSGRYLIIAVCHVIAAGTLQTRLKLCKNSLNVALDEATNNEDYKKLRSY